MSLLDRRYGGAGLSGKRRYKELARAWRHRTFGRRSALYFWTALVLAILAAPMTPRHWQLVVGFVLGMAAAVGLVLPDALLPDHIARWQRGSWGEQETAKALRPLKKEGWLVRHDLASGYGNGNRDHVAVGPAVYLLDSKLLKDEVSLINGVLHVRRVDTSGDSYAIPNLGTRMEAAARSLKRDLDDAVGFPVAVYPVVVIWGHFNAGVAYAGDVAFVAGDKLADWLRGRPADLLDPRKRQAVADWLRALPRA